MTSKFFTLKNGVILIAILLICRMIAMAAMPVFDSSESRYANICSNMFHYQNFLEPQFVYDGSLQNFEGKPPLFFQMGGLCCKFFGIHEFSVRFPAMISAIGILLLLFYTVRKLRDEKTALLAVLFCALTPVFLIFAGLCMTDLMLSFSIIGAICFYMLFSAEKEKKRKKGFSCFFFASLGVGMIVKGPVAIVLAGMPIFLYVLLNNRWKDLKDHAWIGGTLLFLLIAVPWYWKMQMKNPDFLEYFFINENFKRFLFKEYGDRYGAGRESFRGVAVLFYLVCNLPFLLLGLIPLVQKGKKALADKKLWKEYLADPLTGFAFLTVLANTLFWTMTSRVLITYLLPTIPATAILIADLLVRNQITEQEKWAKNLQRIMLFLFCFSCAVCVIGSCRLPEVKAAGGHFFRKIAMLKEYRNCKIYFMRHTPVCAEFYLRDRVIHHPAEFIGESEKSSREHVLIALRMHISDLKDFERKKIGSFGPWEAYAPCASPAVPKKKEDVK